MMVERREGFGRRGAWLGTVALCGSLAGLVVGPGAAAQEKTNVKTLVVRVGQTRQLAVFGGHRSDCRTSVQPDSINTVRQPQLGTLSQRVGVPYQVDNSLSGTCLGYQFLGTAVDYTATRAGADEVALDVAFRNGIVHWVYQVEVRP